MDKEKKNSINTESWVEPNKRRDKDKQKTNSINTESPPESIYDSIFKKILTLSSKSVVRMINGLFNTDYPDDSSLTYNWTEFTKKDYHRILADTIITVNGTHSYHMEAQMEHALSCVSDT